MPIQCRLIDKKDRGKLEPGDMWVDAKVPRERGDAYGLSTEYYRDWADKRGPIWVVLPNGDRFCVDSAYSNGPGYNPERHGWTVSGEAPNITVSPSINCIGRNHGWLQNGVLSDDVDGRTFPAVPA